MPYSCGMAKRILLPTTREFHFNIVVDDTNPSGRLVRTTDEQYDIFVKFRQATQEDEEIRSQIISSNSKYIWRENSMEQPANVDPLTLVRKDVESTIVDTDLEHPEGSRLKFGDKKVDGADFAKWWGAMTHAYTTELYRACLEVNPTWAYKSGV